VQHTRTKDGGRARHNKAIKWDRQDDGSGQHISAPTVSSRDTGKGSKANVSEGSSSTMAHGEDWGCNAFNSNGFNGVCNVNYGAWLVGSCDGGAATNRSR
jgi:hypothetical protein